MWSLLRVEIFKVIKNKVFLVFLTMLTLYCVFVAFFHVNESYSYLNLSIDTIGRDESGFLNSDVQLYGTTLYNQWIGGIGGQSFLPTLFYLLLPLICVIPYGASCFMDRHTGYQRVLSLKKGKAAYALSKYIATFFRDLPLFSFRY